MTAEGVDLAEGRAGQGGNQVELEQPEAQPRHLGSQQPALDLERPLVQLTQSPVQHRHP